MVAGREVAVSNPGKVLFPQAGHTKLDLVRYYLAVADGALRGSGGRPNVLVRYPNGIDGEFFYQKRAPQSRPSWVDVVSLRFPSGRSAEEVVPRDAAALAWMANLACLELHPHPVRAEDLDHPDELRVDLDPVPGITGRRSAKSLVSCTPRSAISASSAGQKPPARVAFTFPSESNVTGPSTKCDARRWPSRARSNGGRRPWRRANGGKKNVMVCSWITTRTPKIAPWPAHTRFGRRPMPAFRRRSHGMRSVCEPGDFTLASMPARFAKIGDRHAGIDQRPCSLAGLLDLSARHEREGLGDAPWPPQYKKQPHEPRRVQPSRRRVAEVSAR